MAAQANIKAVITADDRASATLSSFGNNVSTLGSKITSTLQVAGVAAFVAVTAAVVAASKASWDQVDAVQQATVGLRAYERDSKKVNAVLKDLVSYARSDLGVLFNRKDLFQSAQSLKLMGDNTSDLVDHVKILSRSVGLGLSNWSDLNLIVGRVGSTGRLTGEDFDNLTKAGFKLDAGLRNTNITFTDLFKQLDKGIPADALAGQAETIQGKMIRLDTAFRGVGDAILGVNKETGNFEKGGLGDTIVMTIDNITKALQTPEFKQGIKDTIKQISDGFKSFMEVVKQITLALQPLTDWIKNNDSAAQGFQKALVGLAIMIAAVVIAIGLIVYAVVLLSTAFFDVMNRVNNFTNSVLKNMYGFAVTVKGYIDGFINWFNGVPAGIIKAMGNTVGLLFNVGRNIVQGLINGVTSMISQAIGSVTNLANSIVKNIKKILGIKSPSKVFAGIGENIGLGMIQGIESTIPSVAGAMDGLLPNLTNTNSSSLPQGGTVVRQNTPAHNITIQVGAFMGTQTDARKLAKMVFDSYSDLKAMGNA